MAAITMTPAGIRADLAARLVGRTAAGSNVYDSRRIDYTGDELPAITVTSTGASESRFGTRSFLARRTERVTITGVVTGADDLALAVAVDTMEASILDTLFGDPEWLAAWRLVAKCSVEKTLDIDSKTRVGGVAVSLDLDYDIEYAPIASPGDLATIRITTDTTDPAGADVSVRDIVITEVE